MFDSSRKSTGTAYTATVALVAGALVFSPAILFLTNSFTYFALGVAVAGSAACLAMAWGAWTQTSQLTIPSIVAQRRN